MDFILRSRIVIDFYTVFLCVWWLKRRVDKWKSKIEPFTSDFL
jgi:hypothetical protein